MDNLFAMTIVGSVIVGFILMFRFMTVKIIPAKWQCRIGKMAMAFFLIPFSLIFRKFSFSQPTIQKLMLSGDVTNVGFMNVLMRIYLNDGIMNTIFFIWIIGATIFALWHFYCYNRFIRHIQADSTPISEDSETTILLSLCKAKLDISDEVKLMQNSKIASPMLVGLYRPTILLPSLNIQKNDLKLILFHELMHLKQKDLWVKMLALIASTLHWFNPLVHLLRKDISIWGELSCDESLASEMSFRERKLYGELILNTLEIQSSINVNFCSSLCESKKHIKRRLTMLLKAKKPTYYIAVFAVTTILAIGVIGLAISAHTAKSASELQAYESYADSNKTVHIKNAVSVQSENVVVGDVNDHQHTPQQRLK